jgi:hypothetical protein
MGEPTTCGEERTMLDCTKPLGRKAYGSIPHLPGSRKGQGDHDIGEGPARICTERPRGRWDLVIIQEKLDGACCAVYKDDGGIVALSRSGRLAHTSPYEQHQLFAAWVREEHRRFDRLLQPGERAVGEWLAQAHGTMYELPHEPFVIFDIMRGMHRACYHEVLVRCAVQWFTTPNTLHVGGPLPVKTALELLGEHGGHGALAVAEGLVYRVEYRRGVKHPREVDFLAKWVRPDKVDGLYFPEFRDENHMPPESVRLLKSVYNDQPVWNWRPTNDHHEYP